jgi:DNA-binding CsgD family transcriptional regulator/PAS domain-containing protein
MAFEYNIDAIYRKLYCDHYHMLDLTARSHVPAELAEPMAPADVMAAEDFAKTPFYREWLHPQGLIDFVTVVVDRSPTSVLTLGVFRHGRDGRVDDEARRRMRLVASHVRRAARVARLVDQKQTEADTLAETLDGLSAGMFLIDADGKLLHANAAGRALLGAGEVLNAVHGRLVANDIEAGPTLRRLLATVGHGDMALDRKGIALSLKARNGERHVVHVLPLSPGGQRCAGVSYPASAALFVHKAALEDSRTSEVITKTYNLTPTELRVLLTSVEVGGVAAVAAALGVAKSTIKSHLARLFEKTGTGRQADLVKLVAGFSSPLVGSFSEAPAPGVGSFAKPNRIRRPVDVPS